MSDLGLTPRFCAPFPMFDPAHMLALAPVAEEAGFTSVAVPESVFFPREVSADYPYSPDGSRFWEADTPFTDPVVAIAAMAALTTRLRFVTNVVKAPLRHPLLLAKQVSSLAAISADRLDLGVGSSWIPEEFTWLGESMRTRGARLDEIIDIVRLVCGGGSDWVEFHGRHYEFGPLMVSPAPSRPVPILVGGHSDAALRRAVRVGDGWISVQATRDEIRGVAERLADLLEAAGRTGETFTLNVLCLDVMPDASGVDDYAAFAAELAAMGFGVEYQVVPWFFTGGDPSDLAVRTEALRRFGDEVIGPLGSAT